MNKFDELVKKSLAQAEADALDQDISYNNFSRRLNSGSSEPNRIPTLHPFRRYAAVAACSFALIAAISFGSSSTVRAMAQDAVNSVKMLFVPEVIDNKVEIVQKASNELLITQSCSSSTFLSDAEISDKIGYKVSYPSKLSDFQLSSKSIGVVLGKQVTYDQGNALVPQIQSAILDDSALDKLSEYSPYRTASACYSKDGLDLFICIDKLNEPFTAPSDETTESVKIGDIEGKWFKSDVPEYPIVTENGMSKNDFTQKPQITDKTFLFWENNGIRYNLFTIIDGANISKEDAVKIASEFMSAQAK